MQRRLAETLAPTGIRQFRYFDTVGSTNDEALAWADTGAEDYSLVVADAQTRGRGRFDRRWVTNPGVSLAFSLILQPLPGEQEHLALFAPLCGLAIRDAIQVLTGLEARIKWPNDVLLNRRKVSGTLVEAAWNGASLGGIVLGIGVNLSPGSLPAGEEPLFAATCLEDEAREPVDRYALLREVILAIQTWRPHLGSKKFMRAWQSSLAFVGEQVRIEHSGKSSIIGVLKGVNSQGQLVLTLADGSDTFFDVGDVHLRPGNTSGTED